ITALATLHVTPYSLKGNLILDPNAIAPPPDWATLEALQTPTPQSRYGYLLTPGLAKPQAEDVLYGTIPHQWRGMLAGGASDRPAMPAPAAFS
ncbi:MAG: hypothetical protein ACKO4L_15690, partial [Nodosilinea sp.]